MNDEPEPPDIMRREQRRLTKDEEFQINVIKDLGQHLWNFFDQFEESREMSLAKTKLEEAVMWAAKAISR